MLSDRNNAPVLQIGILKCYLATLFQSLCGPVKTRLGRGWPLWVNTFLMGLMNKNSKF